MGPGIDEFQVLTVLSGIAQSAYKMCGDVRLLANLKEVEEPFAKTQVRVVCSARHLLHGRQRPTCVVDGCGSFWPAWWTSFRSLLAGCPASAGDLEMLFRD